VSDLVETLKARAVDRRLRDVKVVGEANVGPIEGFFDWQTATEISSLSAQLAAQIIIQRGWEDEARKATSQLASARKALEEIEIFCRTDNSTLGAIARLTHIRGTARQQLLSLTDEKGES